MTTRHTQDTDTLAAKADLILASAREKFGFEPNLIREMVKSPAAAQVYLGADVAMEDAALGTVEQEIVKLAVSTRNKCHYCTKAHWLGGRMAGAGEADLNTILRGSIPQDERLGRLVEAAFLIMDKQGWLDAEDLRNLEARGIDRRQVYDIVALIAQKTISNYINHRTYAKAGLLT
jgi:AhpD family alkylhydroperoxidase